MTVSPEPAPAAGRPTLPAWRRSEVEDTRRLLAQVGHLTNAQLTGPLAVFWLGRLHGASMNLLDHLDATVAPE